MIYIHNINREPCVRGSRWKVCSLRRAPRRFWLTRLAPCPHHIGERQCCVLRVALGEQPVGAEPDGCPSLAVRFAAPDSTCTGARARQWTEHAPRSNPAQLAPGATRSAALLSHPCCCPRPRAHEHGHHEARFHRSTGTNGSVLDPDWRRDLALRCSLRCSSRPTRSLSSSLAACTPAPLP
jgi:hypothetical protein